MQSFLPRANDGVFIYKLMETKKSFIKREGEEGRGRHIVGLTSLLNLKIV